MTITMDMASQLDALGLQIFDPHLDVNTLTYTGPATGLQVASTDMDAMLAALIAPVKLAIDGSTLELGFRYTLNITCALKLRPKHWFMELGEYNVANPGVSSQWPCQCGLLCVPDVALGSSWSASSYGFTIGLATCAAICHAWAEIIRLWLAGNYPLAVAQSTLS